MAGGQFLGNKPAVDHNCSHARDGCLDSKITALQNHPGIGVRMIQTGGGKPLAPVVPARGTVQKFQFGQDFRICSAVVSHKTGGKGDCEMFFPEQLTFYTRPVARSQSYRAIIVFAIQINHTRRRRQQQLDI